MLTTRDAILGVQDLARQTLKVPEWGDAEIMIRGMSGVERDEFDKQYTPEDTAGVRARLVVMSVCDGDGALVFAPDDVGEVGKKSARALERIASAAMRLNGMIAPEDAEGN